MASTTGDQSSRTSTGERPRGSRGGSSQTSPLDRLRTAPPAPVRGDVVPEPPSLAPVNISDPSAGPAPIVRLPAPPSKPAAGDGTDPDILVGMDDVVSEDDQSTTGSRERPVAGKGPVIGTPGGRPAVAGTPSVCPRGCRVRRRLRPHRHRYRIPSHGGVIEVMLIRAQAISVSMSGGAADGTRRTRTGSGMTTSLRVVGPDPGSRSHHRRRSR